MLCGVFVFQVKNELCTAAFKPTWVMSLLSAQEKKDRAPSADKDLVI